MKKVKTHYYDCDVPEGFEYETAYSTNDIKDLTFATRLKTIIKNITSLLIEKNQSYGNSALNPAKIFSKLEADEALCSRIDDKLMRIKNRGINDETEDTVDDLIGYLLLLKMAIQEKKGAK